jgi:hypothetical protein
LDVARHHLLWEFIPEKEVPWLRLGDELPDETRQRLLASSPMRSPPKTRPIWEPIRPTARTQT